MRARAGLAMARFCLAAWVGAATLFVVTGVRVAISKQVDLNNSEVIDALVAVRFPSYYLFGFALVSLAGLGLIAAWRHPGLGRIRIWTCSGLIAASLVLMLFDYFSIYLPLIEMVTPAGKAKPSEFTAYHEASKHINSVDVGLLLIAAILLCWPVSNRAPKT